MCGLVVSPMIGFLMTQRVMIRATRLSNLLHRLYMTFRALLSIAKQSFYQEKRYAAACFTFVIFYSSNLLEAYSCTKHACNVLMRCDGKVNRNRGTQVSMMRLHTNTPDAACLSSDR
jgi:hypothetical protein